MQLAGFTLSTKGRMYGYSNPAAGYAVWLTSKRGSRFGLSLRSHRRTRYALRRRHEPLCEMGRGAVDHDLGNLDRALDRSRYRDEPRSHFGTAHAGAVPDSRTGVLRDLDLDVHHGVPGQRS